MTIRPGLILFLFFLLFPSFSHSAASSSFYSRNMNPFVHIYGIPAEEFGQVADPGTLQVRLHADAVSNFTVDETASESILLDGETYRVNTIASYGITEKWDVGLEVPYVSHSRGVFDFFIDDWHQFFGLPEGGRDTRPRQLLQYRYIKEGITRFNITRSTAGLGDVSLTTGYLLHDTFTENEKKRTAVIRFWLKLPTGSADDLRGSGSVDVAAAISGRDAVSLSMLNVFVFGRFGCVYLGEGDVLDEMKKDAALFGGFGIGWRVRPWLELKTQIDAHTALYDSTLDALGGDAAQINMGGAIHFSGNMSLDLNVIEDLSLGAVPDVVFQMSLRKVF